MSTNLEQCPLCGTELSQTKYREIRAKLQQQEQHKAAEIAEAKAAIAREVEIEFKKKIEQETRAAEKRARAEADKEVQKAFAERDAATGKLQAAEARETVIRKQAQAEIERQKQLAEKRAKADNEEQVKKLIAERDQAAKKLKDAEAREEAIRKEAEEKAEKLKQKELIAQRQILENAKDEALRKQRAEHAREKESLLKNVAIMERRLEKKTANELGDSGEIDVLEVLRDAFQGDRITQIRKGQPGADILHEILYKGEVCGRIVTDSKNRQAWQNTYVTKLRQDKVEARAEHAILATTVFPAGKKELCIDSDVIVVSPGRVVHITEILRQAMITMYIKGLSLKERSNKMSHLYNLITSESYSKKFAEAERLTQDILDLDVQEQNDHSVVWRKRGTMTTRMKRVLRDIRSDVDAVIEGSGSRDESIPVKASNGASLRPLDFEDGI